MTLALTLVSDFEARYIPVELTNQQLYADMMQAYKLMETIGTELYNREGPGGPANQFLYHAREYVKREANKLMRGE